MTEERSRSNKRFTTVYVVSPPSVVVATATAAPFLTHRRVEGNPVLILPRPFVCIALRPMRPGPQCVALIDTVDPEEDARRANREAEFCPTLCVATSDHLDDLDLYLDCLFPVLRF